jgi:hypothetical protein
MRNLAAFIAAGLVLASAVPSLLAQSWGGDAPRALEARPVQDRIAIDGRLDEAAWRQADVAADFVQQLPNPGRPATLPTEARVLFSGDAVYVGVRLHDPAPDSIVGRLARRGVANESDWVYVAFDSHLDRRSAFQFGVNAAGVKRDMRIADDVREDASWDAVWDVAVARDEDGWTAEFRIPLSQLRFDAGPGERAWGFNVKRIVARSGEVSTWAPVENNSGSYVSRFGKLTGVRIERAPRRIEVFPYLASRLVWAPGEAADPYHRPTDLSAGAGADLRMGLTSWLTLTGTANPDFGQVEADPSVVNLSAFEVVFPERRPFFIEGDEYFRTPRSNLFYSRRIGRSPQLGLPGDALFADRPDRTTILGAAKLTGRSPGGWSVGMLGALTAEETAAYVTADGESSAVVEPLTSYAVTRIGRDFRSGRSAINVTATATNRFLDDSPAQSLLRREAYAGGIDARHRFGGNRYEISSSLYLSHVAGDTLAIARTQRAPGRYFQRPDADHVTFRSDRTSLAGHTAFLRFARVAGGPWRAGVNLSSVSPGYEINDLGSQFVVDRAHQYAWVSYNQFTAGRIFRRWSVQADQSSLWTHGGEQIDINATLESEVELHNRWTVRLWGMRHQGGIDPDALRGGPAYFNPGIRMGSVTVNSDRRRTVSGHIHVYADVLDADEGRQLMGNASLAWRPSDRSELILGPSFHRRTNGSQFVAARNIPALGGTRYVLGDIDQTTTALNIRLNHALTPDLTLELHARPFIAAGRYDAYHAVVDGAARDRERGHRLATYPYDRVRDVTTSTGQRLLEIDATGDGTADIRIPHPDFNRKDFRSTAVLRWEFRPGSTLFVVWSHDRSRLDADGRFDPVGDLDRL